LKFPFRAEGTARPNDSNTISIFLQLDGEEKAKDKNYVSSFDGKYIASFVCHPPYYLRSTHTILGFSVLF